MVEYQLPDLSALTEGSTFQSADGKKRFVVVKAICLTHRSNLYGGNWNLFLRDKEIHLNILQSIWLVKRSKQVVSQLTSMYVIIVNSQIWPSSLILFRAKMRSSAIKSNYYNLLFLLIYFLLITFFHFHFLVYFCVNVCMQSWTQKTH